MPTRTRPAPDPTSSQGARADYKNSRFEPDDHAIGRSRGGLTTKIHALTNQATDPVIVPLTGGQAGDNPELVPLLKAHELFHGPARKNGSTCWLTGLFPSLDPERAAAQRRFSRSLVNAAVSSMEALDVVLRI